MAIKSRITAEKTDITKLAVDAIVNAESTVAGDDGSSSGRSLTVGSLTIDMLGFGDAM